MSEFLFGSEDTVGILVGCCCAKFHQCLDDGVQKDQTRPKVSAEYTSSHVAGKTAECYQKAKPACGVRQFAGRLRQLRPCRVCFAGKMAE